MFSNALSLPALTNVVWHHATVTRARREVQNVYLGAIVWLPLYPDRANLRWRMLLKDLYISAVAERLSWMEIMRDMGFVATCGSRSKTTKKIFVALERMAKLFIEAGIIVLTAFISPYRADRVRVRGMVKHGEFIGIHCDTPINICEDCDVKNSTKKLALDESSNSRVLHLPTKFLKAKN